MRSPRLAAFFALLLVFSSLVTVRGAQDYKGYQILVNGDCSAKWSIVVVSDINITIDSWEGFQQKIFTLVEEVATVADREMSIDPESVNMEILISWETQSKTTKFSFVWINFSLSEDAKLVFGDVFGVQPFFDWLYGDGTLLISYPEGYTVSEVSPAPDRQDAVSRTIEWFRTQDFLNGDPRVVLQNSSSPNRESGWVLYLGLGLALALVVASLVVFFVRQRKSKAVPLAAASVVGASLESDEEKVIKFVRSSGGKVRQSSIVEQFGFSKAKASQLLSSLEANGIVARYKSGRDKIVTLIERAEDDKP